MTVLRITATSSTHELMRANVWAAVSRSRRVRPSSRTELASTSEVMEAARPIPDSARMAAIRISDEVCVRHSTTNGKACSPATATSADRPIGSPSSDARIASLSASDASTARCPISPAKAAAIQREVGSYRALLIASTTPSNWPRNTSVRAAGMRARLVWSTSSRSRTSPALPRSASASGTWINRIVKLSWSSPSIRSLIPATEPA